MTRGDMNMDVMMNEKKNRHKEFVRNIRIELPEQNKGKEEEYMEDLDALLDELFCWDEE